MASVRKFSKQLDGYIHKFRLNGHHEVQAAAAAPEPKRVTESGTAASIGRKLAQILPRRPIRSSVRFK